MSDDHGAQPPHPSRAGDHDNDRAVMAKPSRVGVWAWFILKNLVGWVLVIAAFPLGAFIPGPGGIPLFLIGFGLITFPGKRRATARMMRGIPIARDSKAYRVVVALLAAVLPGLMLFYLVRLDWVSQGVIEANRPAVFAAYAVASVVLFWIGLRSHGLVNKLIARIPRMRRKVRPWLRHKGIDLLPPRRRNKITLQNGHVVRHTNPEILEIHERHMTRVRSVWAVSKPWVRRVLGIVITVAIFYWIIKPIVLRWDDVREHVATIRWSTFFLSAAIFAVFLFAFRMMVWRRILKRFGHRLPIAPATRIWATSELARYLPGVIWQVVGRVYLVKPYGVRGSHCSASQILELAIFLLANLLVALGCLAWLGVKSMDGLARAWMYVAMVMVPLLILLLHPRVLYRILNGILKRLGKPTIVPRLRFRSLTGLLLWTVLGLLVQSYAIFLIIEEPLGGLQPTKWWVVAGAYCLAWCAGFLAFWAPGGLGVRELVFIAALGVALPPAVRHRFDADPAELTGIIMFLSVLLRLWATTGELMLTGVAYSLDWKGAMRGGENVSPPPRGGALRTEPKSAPLHGGGETAT